MPSTPVGFTLVTKDVAVYPEHTVTLTLYVPDKAGKYPAVLDIHGGGWKDRQVEQVRHRSIHDEGNHLLAEATMGAERLAQRCKVVARRLSTQHLVLG